MQEAGKTIRWAAMAAVLCCVLAVLCLLCFAPRAQAAQTQVNIPYTQVFTSDDASVDATFTYTLVAQDYTATTPMPTGSTGDTYSFNITGNTTGNVAFDTAGAPNGTYVYTIQDASVHKPNYTYEQRSYTVKVYVDGTYTVTTIECNTDAKKVALVEVDPTYKAPAPPASGKVTVEKQVQSAQIQPNGTIVYSFVVTNVSDSDAVGVWVKDHLPDYTNYESCDSNGVFIADSARGSVSWFINKLTPGSVQTLKLVVKLDGQLPEGVTIKNTAAFQVLGNEDPPDFNDEPNVAPGSDGGYSNTTVSTPENPVPTPNPQPVAKKINTAKTGDSLGFAAGLLALIVVSGTAVVLSVRLRKQRS